jgi:urease accessory protein
MPTLTSTEVRSTHLRAFALPSYDATRRLALVPEQAVLLAGDQVSVSVRVGAGHSLEIVEPGGTVAYAMRGRQARWDVTVEVDAGGSLVWHGEPFVVAEGADVLRSMSIELASGARVVLRETLVLGRTGEAPGRLMSRTAVHRDGVPVLVEELDAALGLGPHRVVDQVLELRGFETGAERPPQPPEGPERPPQPPGRLAERPRQPPEGAERPPQPPGRLAERPRQPPEGAERPPQPPERLAERPPQPPERLAERPPEPPEGAERPPQPAETAMVLESGDLLHRWLGDETHRSPLRVCQSSPRAE